MLIILLMLFISLPIAQEIGMHLRSLLSKIDEILPQLPAPSHNEVSSVKQKLVSFIVTVAIPLMKKIFS